MSGAPLHETIKDLFSRGWELSSSQCTNPGLGSKLWMVTARRLGVPIQTGQGKTLEAAVADIQCRCAVVDGAFIEPGLQAPAINRAI